MCQRNGFGGYKSFCLTYILYGLWGIIRVYNNNNKKVYSCGEICKLTFSLYRSSILLKLKILGKSVLEKCNGKNFWRSAAAIKRYVEVGLVHTPSMPS